MARYRVGLWCAVSSKPQAADDKSSLADQEEAGRRFAEAVGGEVVRVYTVPGHSRTAVFWHEAEAAIPAYRDLREDIAAGRIDVLHALDATRLGRDTALVQQFYSLAQRHGVEVYLASAPHQLGQQTTAGRIVPAVLSVFAQTENETKTHRQRQGMRRRVLREGRFGCALPLGYSRQPDGSYTLNDAAASVRRITELYLSGMPIPAIVRTANAERLPTAKGGAWAHTSIRHILDNPSYAGYPSWGGQRPETPSTAYPAIWDEATFRAVRAERARRRKGYTRRGGSMLTGVVFCRRCGRRMVRLVCRGIAYLRCSTQARHVMGSGEACARRLVREDAVLAAIEAWFRENVSEDVLRATYTAPDMGVLGAECKQAEERLVTLQTQRERLALAYAAGAMGLDMYSIAEESLRAQQAEAEMKARELRAALEDAPDVDRAVADVLWVRDNLATVLREDDPAAVARILQGIGLRVEVEGGRVAEVTLTT